MEPRLTEIYPNEVLIYLGYHGGTLPDNVQEEIQRCGNIILETARPRLVYRQFEIGPDGSFLGTDFRPEGNDVKALLRESRQAVMAAATLGLEVEQLLRRTQVTNVGKALILDCCASSAIENVMDNFCEDLERQVQGYLTDRFSPGYGDFPFAQQPEFCRCLDVSRRIGVTLTPGGLMIPQKSVTAVIGIADRPQKKRFRGCAFCSKFETCTYRKEGKTCGKQ